MSDQKLIECSASAPGKVILHGEHSVVFGKTAIAASFGLRCQTTIKEQLADDPCLVINLPQLQIENITFNIKSLTENLGDIPLSEKNGIFNWSTPNLIDHSEFLKKVSKYLDESHKATGSTDTHRQGLIMVLYLFSCIINKNYLVNTSLEVTVDSELTIGAGTGSSASYAVSLSAAMLQYLRLKSQDMYYSVMEANKDKKNNLSVFTNDEKKIISAWAFCSEKIAHGTPSGIDNTTCTFGSLVEFRKGSEPIHHSLKVKLKVLLVNTCVARQTRILAQKVVALRQRCPKAVDNIIEALNEVALSALKVVNNINTTLIDQEENFKQLAELFDMNHNLLAALGVSHQSLENIRAISAEFGFSSKLTGAGGGGYAIVLIPPNADDSKVENLIKKLNETGYIATLTHLGGEGVTIDTKSRCSRNMELYQQSLNDSENTQFLA